MIQWRGTRCPPWRRPARRLSGPQLGPGRGRGAGSGGRGCRGGQSTKAGPDAGRALYRGRRLRQEAGGGGGGSHAAPRGGRGQRPGRARRTAGCGPDPGLRPTRIPAPASASALHSRAPAPPSLAPPSAPSSRELRRPKLGEKFPNFRQSGRSAPARVPRLPAFPLGPQSSAARRPWKPEPSPELPCPLARPPTLFPAWPAGPRGPVTCGRNPTRLPSPWQWQLLAGAPPAPLPGAELCQGSAPASPARRLPFPSLRLPCPCAGRVGPGPLTPP